jgi:hypothetical protein
MSKSHFESTLKTIRTKPILIAQLISYKLINDFLQTQREIPIRFDLKNLLEKKTTKKVHATYTNIGEGYTETKSKEDRTTMEF